MVNKICRVTCIALLWVIIVTGCKKYADPPPYFEDDKDSSTVQTSRRVLFIGISGAVGAQYKIIAPPQLMKLKEHSKFSWDAVSDAKTTDASSWKTILTGLSYSSHQIQDSSFIFKQPANGSEHAAIVQYPSFFNYLLSSSKPDTKTAFVSTWPALLNVAAPEIETKVLAATDAAVKDSVIAMLKTRNPEIVMVDFNSVSSAGKQYGFDATAAGYKDAVLKVDSYVGDIITALQSRPEYDKKEEWLVVINGTHGGTLAGAYGEGTTAESNVISFYYNPRFKPTEFTKEGVFYGVEIKDVGANQINAILPNPTGRYDIGTGSKTIEFKLKGGGGNYPHFFNTNGATNDIYGFQNAPGLTCFTGGGHAEVQLKSNSGQQTGRYNMGEILDGKWHTISFVVLDSIAKRWFKVYSDGKLTAQQDISSFGDITSKKPIVLGYVKGDLDGAAHFYFSDIKIFNAGLTGSEVANNLCLKDITKHPQYANLVGYWPCNEGFGGLFSNRVTTAASDNFVLSGPYKWDILADYPCTANILSSGSLVSRFLTNTDFARTMFYWLRIPVLTSWPISGNLWLNNYEGEFIVR